MHGFTFGPVHARRPDLRGWLAAAAMALALLPAAASAQNNGGARPGLGGAMAMLATGRDLRAALDDMDLPADTKTKVDAILAKAQADLREQAQGLRDLPPEERLQKVQELAKEMTDAKAKIVDALTPPQQVTLSQKLAVLAVTRAVTIVAAEKKAAADVDVPDDKKAQLTAAFEDAAKSLDRYKADADAVKDVAAGDAVVRKAQRATQELQRRLVELLGPDGARPVIAAGMRTQRPTGGGGAIGGRRRAAATDPAK